ncbi:hypothetical protein N7457_001615 [Penicillium paradoxum]|uniref:uncharacterized protein n=1 Tax=Penicillium paradoxum TaxID=176176 RepID=UPI002547FA4C|nr:uncharacterized protein N7457_001615 [Penicillium paradoxum]KAJ5795016.1 hypothetical protein N7457_001615 [Penicillium paradoxum]
MHVLIRTGERPLEFEAWPGGQIWGIDFLDPEAFTSRAQTSATMQVRFEGNRDSFSPFNWRAVTVTRPQVGALLAATRNWCG